MMSVFEQFPPKPLRWRSLLSPALASVFFTYFNLYSEINLTFAGLWALTVIAAYFFALLFGLPIFMLLERWIPWFLPRLCVAGLLSTFIPIFLLSQPLLLFDWIELKFATARAVESGVMAGIYGLLGAVIAWILNLPIEK